MEKYTFFTCQIAPIPAAFRSFHGHDLKRKSMAQLIRTPFVALLFIMSIAIPGALNTVQSASKKSQLQLIQNQYNTAEKMSILNDKTTSPSIISPPENIEMIKVISGKQFPVYIPFYFFFLGFFLVLVQKWILVKNNDGSNGKKNGYYEPSMHNKKVKNSQREFFLEGRGLTRETFISVPMSN
jgi:hypothetical protein